MMWTRTDPIPPIVRSTYRTQAQHSRLAAFAETNLAHHAECLALKSGLSFADLPPIPPGAWIYFHPPLAGHHGYLHYDHDLHPSAEPMPKAVAIPLIHGVVAFAIQLSQWAYRLRTEFAVLHDRVCSVDTAPSWFGYRKEIRWEWSQAIVEVVQKWDRVVERQDELERWVGGAKAWIGRLEDAVTGVDVPWLDGNEVQRRSELYTVPKGL